MSRATTIASCAKTFSPFRTPYEKSVPPSFMRPTHPMTPSTSIQLATSEEAIAATFEVLSQLRPNLERTRFVAEIRALGEAEGFCLAVLREDGIVRAVAGI